MRPITFSTTFPSYHPRKGQPTGFVEKILAHIYPLGIPKNLFDRLVKEVPGFSYSDKNVKPKVHTIRKGNRWKPGDWFQPVIWSGRPYHSPQVKFAPPMQVKKTWDFEIFPGDYLLKGKPIDLELLKRIAANDGLSADDLEAWFYPYAKKEPCACQIICWNDKIEY